MKNKIKELKNWDNKTWLSSSAYINSFNTFLLKKKKLNKNSQILDIGCGRGKIFGVLSRKVKLLNKPIGIDPVVHRDVDKSIDFKDFIGFPDMSYGWSKLTCEYLAKLAYERKGLKSVCYRPFSGYGEDQDLSYPFPSICKRVIENKNSKAKKNHLLCK